MKKRLLIIILIIISLYCVFSWLGIGYYTSGSAKADLQEALTVLYGEPYMDREGENGTESMKFLVESNTFFLTNYNLRNALGLDYQYTCSVIYSFTKDGETEDTCTITYKGIDPMGKDKENERAYLVEESVEINTSK